MQISIVIPMYNSALYIKDLLQDLKNQTKSDFKLIIVDDCSNDDSVKMVEDMGMANLSLISLEHNVGRSKARNIGLKHVETDFVVFIDSDDRISQHFIEDFEKLYDVSSNSEILILGWTNTYSDLKKSSTDLNVKSMNESELLWNILANKKVFYSLWNKAFSVNKIREKGITFPDFIFSEDLIFIFNFVMQNNINSAVVDTQQIDYYWRPSIAKNHVNNLSGNDTRAFDENYEAIMSLRNQLESSKRTDLQLLLNELDYILVQHYVHSPNVYSKLEFLLILTSALKSKASFTQKIRLIFNFVFGINLEKALYRQYMKYKNQNA